ncbi:MAG: SWIB/MDM2 domain-containing protein [Sphingomonas sp.]
MADKQAARGGIAKPVTPSPAACGDRRTGPRCPRSEVVSKIWAYIKTNNLQNPANKREILADAKLEPIFGGKSATMFEMNKHLSKHMS